MNIVAEDFVNGPGIRVSLFVSGCTNKCPGCFNPSSWSFEAGTPFTDKTIDTIIELCKKEHIAGLSLLGGDPLHVRNQEEVCKLIKKFKEQLPDKNIWIWSGYKWEDTFEGGIAYTEYSRDILALSDVLIDGPFIEELKSLRLKYKGSKNQRLLDLQATESKGKPVLYKLSKKQ